MWLASTSRPLPLHCGLVSIDRPQLDRAGVRRGGDVQEDRVAPDDRRRAAVGRQRQLPGDVLRVEVLAGDRGEGASLGRLTAAAPAALRGRVGRRRCGSRDRRARRPAGAERPTSPVCTRRPRRRGGSSRGSRRRAWGRASAASAELQRGGAAECDERHRGDEQSSASHASDYSCERAGSRPRRYRKSRFGLRSCRRCSSAIRMAPSRHSASPQQFGLSR